LSFKPLFSRSLSADPERLHFAAHSHHLWPDASFEGQVEAWNDAARLADRKWDKVMDEVWPEAQAHVADELGTGQPEAIVFAPNTHELLVRLFAAASSSWPIRVLTSDGEFHSARRQFARWEEAGAASVERVAVEPFDSFSARFLDRACSGEHGFIFVSQVLFGSGHSFDRVDELAALGHADGPWVVIDGYHAFMAIPLPLAGGEEARSAEGVGASCEPMPNTPTPQPPPASGRGSSAFYLGGGYKYAMAGEGCAFMHAPPGFGERPRITGWFAEFEDLSLPPGSVGYARDASRFLGATFDPSGLYRFNAVQRMLRENGLATARISERVAALQKQLLETVGDTPLAEAELLNPLDTDRHARFLAFRSAHAQRWYAELKAQNCITDVRGDVLRIGFGIYQDEEDVDRLVQLLGRLS
jgi:selenocysteine lyase/cysteine desulfurase